MTDPVETTVAPENFDLRRDNDLVKGRSGNHRYNLEYPPPPIPEPTYKKDGTLKVHQPKREKPKHNTASVTTISGSLAIAGLPWAAAKETALYAVHKKADWMALSPEMAVERLRTWHDRVWALKREVGNITHFIALQWAIGNYTVELDPLLEFNDKGEPRGWSDEETGEVARRVEGCVDALELFYMEQRPIWNYVEQPVIMPSWRYKHGDEYIVDDKTSTGGCFDGDGVLRDYGHLLLDAKTGGRYPDKETLQMAGYQRSKLLATYDENGYLVDINDYVAPKRCASLHLNDDGTYEVLVLPVNGAARMRFNQLRRQYEWDKTMRAWVKEHPAPLDEISLEEALAASLAGVEPEVETEIDDEIDDKESAA